MIRLVKMSDKWYGMKIAFIDDEEVENIETFVNAGEPVLLCCDLEEAKECLDTDIEMIE